MSALTFLPFRTLPSTASMTASAMSAGTLTYEASFPRATLPTLCRPARSATKSAISVRVSPSSLPRLTAIATVSGALSLLLSGSLRLGSRSRLALGCSAVIGSMSSGVALLILMPVSSS